MMYYYYYSPVVFRSQLYFSLCTMSIFLLFLVLSLLIPTHNAQDYYSDIYKLCSQSVTSACGTTIEGAVEYPFWGEDIRPSHCGLDEFKLSCDEDKIVVDLGSDRKYRVVAIHPQTTMLVLEHYKDPLVDICESSSVSSTILNTSLYYYNQNTKELLLFYNCSNEIDTSSSIELKYQCLSSNKNQVYFYEKTLYQAQGDKFGLCSNATLPVGTSVFENFMNNTVKPKQLFEGSFEVQYYSTNQKACAHCVETGGLCWHGTSSKDKNTCLHSNGTLIPLSPGKNKNAGVITAAVVGSIGVGMFLLLIFLVLYRRRKLKRGSSAVSQNVSSYSFSMSDSEKGGGTYMGVPIFSYNELEKATNNFDSGNELGDGGFGTVYKGKLQDGREVAVKRLYENSFKRVEQFMNEIAILAKLRHPNLVVLYGSTSHECRKLLLVYEYIPNGTIADHLYEEDAKPGNLTWKTRMSIAVETSSALLYLHLSEVIHRDVKTTNILLDDNFHVKVADFGLSRLFPQNFTHVSTAPQGTPGYVDPEYHQCYQLTTKSDVYSFGVVLIELISSKPAVDITRHRHEINLANLAINKIQGDALHELVDPSLGFESDYEIRNMISEVAELAFRCLQNDRESRPSMDEVHISLKEIQNRYYGEKNELTDNVFRDDALLLKNHPPNRSPDSVTVNWVSTSTNSSSSR